MLSRDGAAQGMEREEAERRAAGLRIREARKAAKLTQAQLAKALNLPQSVISDWERGELVSWRDHVEPLAKLVNEQPSYFVTPSERLTQRQGVADVPVVGYVQGGSFRMAFEVPVDERKSVQVAVEQYQAYHVPKLRALKVVGDSVNELYPDGTYVIVVPVADTYVAHGDKVVVFARQGEAREATVKEIRFENGQMVLYPRSTNTDYKPIVLREEDQDSFEIAYVVVGSSRIEERAPPPLPWPRSPA